MKKYELTEETILVCDLALYRIRALRDFGRVKAGDLGGFIETEDNLSHDGGAWVYDDAEVFGNAKVYGIAWVFENAKVYGNAKVSGDALVFGNARVFGNAKVYGKAEVFGNTWVFGTAKVFGTARVFENTKVYGDICVSGDSKVSGDAQSRKEERERCVSIVEVERDILGGAQDVQVREACDRIINSIREEGEVQ
jgi:hypothetical protein